ncbi:MAG: hypothetical protein JSV65_07560 [Armatimonadota bacterium]|nr:MAG: hypothetical protein JSV65_07560 [Armatimonadota bacterium]
MRRVAVALPILTLGLVLCACSASAHQPRIVESGKTPIVVEAPEVSKAYYGELDGAPRLFAVRSDHPFILYVNVLVPRIPGIQKNISAEIRDGKGNLVAELDGPNFRWTEFHEPFGGDDYYRGPEFSKDVEAGEYTITVFNSGNRGKYVLAVGEKEEFPFSEMVRTVAVLPRLKSEFFERSPLTILFSYTGAFLAVPLLAITAVAYLFVRWRRSSASSRHGRR